MTISPEAALAAALRQATLDWPYAGEWNWDEEALAAAILAALDGWTLVPSDEGASCQCGHDQYAHPQPCSESGCSCIAFCAALAPQEASND